MVPGPSCFDHWQACDLWVWPNLHGQDLPRTVQTSGATLLVMWGWGKSHPRGLLWPTVQETHGLGPQISWPMSPTAEGKVVDLMVGFLLVRTLGPLSPEKAGIPGKGAASHRMKVIVSWVRSIPGKALELLLPKLQGRSVVCGSGGAFPYWVFLLRLKIFSSWKPDSTGRLGHAGPPCLLWEPLWVDLRPPRLIGWGVLTFCPRREGGNCCNSSGWSGLLRSHLDFRALLLWWCLWWTFHGSPAWSCQHLLVWFSDCGVCPLTVFGLAVWAVALGGIPIPVTCWVCWDSNGCNGLNLASCPMGTD